MATVVLASGSPRRVELLHQLGLDPVVRIPDIDEAQLEDEDPHHYVERLAIAKSRAVNCDAHELVIAADTIVVIDHQILGKPVDHHDAVDILKRLSARSHEVITGVSVRTPDQIVTRTVSTQVEFVTMLDATIDWYVSTGEPMDKAGAYGIQGRGGAFVRRLVGSASNVIGLPLAETVEMFAALGHPVDSLRR